MAQNEILTITARMVDRASRVSRTMGRNVIRVFRTMGRGVLGFAKRLLSVKGAVVAIAAALGGGFLGGHANDVAVATAELGKWSAKLRTTPDELSKLAFAAEQNGASTDMLVEGLKTMQERLDDASRGSATYQEHLRMIGVRATDAQGRVRNVVDVLPEVAAGVRELAKTDPGRLTLFAEDFLGGSEHFLSLLLEQGPEAIRLYGEALEKLGAVVTPEQAKNATEYVRMFKVLQTVIRAIKREVVDQLLPTDLLNAMANFLSENRERIVTVIVAGVRLAIDLVQTLIGWISKLIDFLQAPFTGWLSGLEDAREKIFGTGLLPGASEVRDQMRELGRVLALELKHVRAGTEGGDGFSFAASAKQSQAEIRALGVEFVKLGGSAREAGHVIDRAVFGGGSGIGQMLDDRKGFMERYKNRTVDFDRLNGLGGGGEGDGVRSSEQGNRIGATGQLMDDFFGNFHEGINSAIVRWASFGQAGLDAADTIVDSLGNGLSNALADGILKISSFREAFKELSKSVIQDITRMATRLATSALFSFLGSGFGLPVGSLFAAANGAVFPGGIRRLARGGVTNGPEMALIGDNPGGAEAVLPLERRGGKLGVRASGGGGGISITLNLTAQMIDGANSERWIAQHSQRLAVQIASEVQRVAALKGAIAGVRS